LATGELVYQGVVRTPLCALAPRIDWRGTPHNVMNEFFASAADVVRLTGELKSDHDLLPSADNAAKDLPATRQRLARMIGLDQRDASPAEWLTFARAWRAAQVDELGGQLRRVMAAHRLGPYAVLVSAGCGDFLVPDVLARASVDMHEPAPEFRLAVYGCDVACIAAQPSAGRAPASSLLRTRPPPSVVQAWAQVCAPCVATASLFDRDHR
jgi:probable H4MPT-linked C1 transfer pathway protein